MLDLGKYSEPCPSLLGALGMSLCHTTVLIAFNFETAS